MSKEALLLDAREFWKDFGVYKTNNNKEPTLDAYYSTHYLRQILDQLESLSRFNNTVVVVEGARGIGKTTCMENLTLQLKGDCQVLELAATGELNVTTLLRTMAKRYQLDEMVFKETHWKPVIEKYLQTLQSRHINAILLIDDANRLPLPTLDALFYLASLQKQGNHGIRTILFSTSTIEQRIKSIPFPYASEEHRCTVSLRPFSIKDGIGYIENRLRHSGFVIPYPITLTQMKTIHYQAKGNPLTINILLLKSLVEIRERKLLNHQKPPIEKKWYALGIATTLILGFTAGSLIGKLANPLDKSGNLNHSTTSIHEFSAVEKLPIDENPATLTTLIDNLSERTLEKTLDQISEEHSRPTDNAIIPSKNHEPSEKSGIPIKTSLESIEPKTTLSEQSVPGKVKSDNKLSVESIFDLVSEIVPKDNIDTTPAKKEESIKKIIPAKTVMITSPVKIKPKPKLQPIIPDDFVVVNSLVDAISDEQVLPIPENHQTQLYTQSEKEVLALNPKAYTIQLLSTSNLQALHEKVKRLNLTKQAWVVSRTANGKQDFILVYGHYPNYSAAKKAAEHLPTPLKQHLPWIKNWHSVQSAIHLR